MSRSTRTSFSAIPASDKAERAENERDQLILFKNLEDQRQIVENVSEMSKKNKPAAAAAVVVKKLNPIEVIEKHCDATLGITPGSVIRDCTGGKSNASLMNVARLIGIFAKSEKKAADEDKVSQIVRESHHINGGTKKYELVISEETQVTIRALLNDLVTSAKTTSRDTLISEEINKINVKQAEELRKLKQSDPDYVQQVNAISMKYIPQINKILKEYATKDEKDTAGAAIAQFREDIAFLIITGLNTLMNEKKSDFLRSFVNSSDFHDILVTEKDKGIYSVSLTGEPKEILKQKVKKANLAIPGLGKYKKIEEDNKNE